MGVIKQGAQKLSAAANDMPRRESWWACEDGCWKYYDTRSPHVYNRADPDYDHNSRWFFFQHQKMVKRALEGNKVILKWHVKRVSPGALIAAVIYLDERAPRGKSVRLEFDFGGWHYLEVRTPAEAIELIPKIQALRSTEPLLATQIQEQPFDLLEESPAVIREGLRAWQRSGGSMAARSTTILMPRALVFGWCDAQDELVFDHIGPLSLFAQTYGRGWRELVRGKRSDEGMPGQKLDERKLAQPYLDVLEAGEPRFEHARVPIRDVNTQETTWRSYHRLLLPFRDPRGAPQLVCLCADSAAVNLPGLIDNDKVGSLAN